MMMLKFSSLLFVFSILSTSLVGQTVVNSWPVEPLGTAFVGGVHYDPATDRVWIADETNDFITAYDGSGNLVVQYVAQIPPNSGLTLPMPIGVGVDPSTGMLWVGDEGEWVYELDPATGIPTGLSWPTVAAISDVSGVSVNPATGNIYVTQDSGVRLVAEFDQAGNVLQVIDVTAISGDPDGLAFHPGTGHWYLGDDTADAIYEIDSAGALVASWSLAGLGISPEGLGIDASTGLMYIGDGFITRSIYVVDGIVSGGGGGGLTLSVANLVAGSTTTLSLANANAVATCIIAYSVYGGGPTNTPVGSVDLSPPIRQLPAVQADSAGAASISASVPPHIGGMNVWIQAVDLSGPALSNSLALTVQ